MKKSYLFLADGFEEIEALATVDVLRRANIDLLTVSINSDNIATGAHGVPVLADMRITDLEDFDADILICPGGMPGAKNLSENEKLLNLLQNQYDAGKHIAAICAAPALVFSKLKLQRKYKMTCYPGFESYLSEQDVQTDGVVVDDKIITGKGPALGIEFGLKIVEQLISAEAAQEVANGMLCE